MRIVITDREKTVIEEIIRALQKSGLDYELEGTAQNGQKGYELIESTHPDLIIMDVRLEGMDGLTMLKKLRDKGITSKVLMLTKDTDFNTAREAIELGADSYLLKGVSLDELYQAITTVMAGGGVIHPDVAIKAMRMFSDMANRTGMETTTEVDTDCLSHNEWKIIAKVSQGLSNREIADELAFSEGTVRNYISSVLDKLYLRDRTQLAIWALQNSALVHRESEK